MEDSLLKAKELIATFSHIENIDGLINAVRYDLVNFVEQQNKKPEDTSVLSCTKKISEENGQDLWAFFCSIINFSVQVKKFMIPMLNGIAESIKGTFEGNFITFVRSSIYAKKQLLTNFAWEWTNKNGEPKKQIGWSHHRILKVHQLIYILQTLKVILGKDKSFYHHAKKLYQESKNFVEFTIKFVESFHGEPRIFGSPKLTSQKCFKRYLLFFRWVAGLDPDLHLWTFISHNELLPPVDVTVKRVLKRVGVFDREYGCKWKDVLRYSDFLALINPHNKLWADFYLSRLGITGICKSKKVDSNCEICPLQKFCIY